MKLGRWLKKNNMLPAALARAIGVTKMAVSKWLNGVDEPRPDNARKIIAMTNGEVTLEDLYPVPRRKKASGE